MNRTPVQSSTIASVGYHVDSSLLEIEFHSGGIYQYYDVPEHQYNDLMSADSLGKYFAANIRDVYRCSRIG
ncbi:MAG TPA: KTSC domain-containing protein [Candidatus Hodarchaeales archaeon]|nr:KTSC domain-containing protein [Candidatus Hodarchaeales archaeon]